MRLTALKVGTGIAVIAAFLTAFSGYTHDISLKTIAFRTLASFIIFGVFGCGGFIYLYPLFAPSRSGENRTAGSTVDVTVGDAEAPEIALGPFTSEQVPPTDPRIKNIGPQA